jgi:hypothetical protein
VIEQESEALRVRKERKQYLMTEPNILIPPQFAAENTVLPRRLPSGIFTNYFGTNK